MPEVLLVLRLAYELKSPTFKKYGARPLSLLGVLSAHLKNNNLLIKDEPIA
jgi:hypothetical protein